MKIVNIIGGLGNQMFQYAYAIRWKAMNPDERVLLDLSHFRGYALHNGYEIARIFGQQLPTASWWDIFKVSWYLPWYKPSRILHRLMPPRRTECNERPVYTWNPRYEQWRGNGYFDGYWQYPVLLEPYREQILKAFTFPDFEDDKNRELANRMSQCEAVSVHVRRGDYVKAKAFKNICTTEYYLRAIEQARAFCTNPVFFIFSNDIGYCHNIFLDLEREGSIVYVDFNHGESSFRDMQLMSLAKVNIVANSSFSWWGAWLNRRPENVTIAPTPWANFTDSLDMIPSNWIKISGR
jgi:hypothetical protein